MIAKNNMKPSRAFLNVLVFVSIFVMPFWFSLGVILFGLFVIPYYVESLIALFCLELLYQGTMLSHETLFRFFPIVIVTFFFVVQGFRQLVREHIFRF